MRVVVIGMGETGFHVARILSRENHDVTIVDSNPDRLRQAEEAMDVMSIRGHGASLRVLREVRSKGVDLVVCVTGSDEVNVLAASTAKSLGAKRTIARISRGDYVDSHEHVPEYELIGVDLVISQQMLTAIEIHRLVKSFGATAVEMFMDNQIEMIELSLQPGLDVLEKPIRDLDIPSRAILAGILRGDQFVVPTGVDTLFEGDEVFLVGELAAMPRLEKMFGKTGERQANKVLVVGGGEIGLAVTRLLVADRLSVVVIEQDRERCQVLSELLPDAVVIHGDGKNLTLLQEERIEDCDVFVAVSGQDDTNLMATLLARHLGARKTICLVSRGDYIPIYDTLGIHSSISPRRTVANRILKYVRQGEVVSVTMVAGGKAELLELVATEDCKLAGKRLRDIGIPHGALVLAIQGKEGLAIPRGGEQIRTGDTVLLMATPEARPAVERLFGRKSLFG